MARFRFRLEPGKRGLELTVLTTMLASLHSICGTGKSNKPPPTSATGSYLETQTLDTRTGEANKSHIITPLVTSYLHYLK